MIESCEFILAFETVNEIGTIHTRRFWVVVAHKLLNVYLEANFTLTFPYLILSIFVFYVVFDAGLVSSFRL